MKTNIAIKSDKFTPFGGIFPIMKQIDLSGYGETEKQPSYYENDKEERRT